MTKYLSCIKQVKGLNDEHCRLIAKNYLSCRMEKNLMAKDEFKNLGFAEPPASALLGKNKDQKGVKGELHW